MLQYAVQGAKKQQQQHKNTKLTVKNGVLHYTPWALIHHTGYLKTSKKSFNTCNWDGIVPQGCNMPPIFYSSSAGSKIKTLASSHYALH